MTPDGGGYSGAMEAQRAPLRRWIVRTARGGVLHLALVTALAAALGASSVAAGVWEAWPGDLRGMRLFQGILNGFTEPVASAITFLGDRVPRMVATAVAIGWLVCLRQPRRALCFTAALLLQLGLVRFLKAAVARPRPELPIGLEAYASYGDYSFPSGHVAFAALFCWSLLYFLLRRPRASGWMHRVLVVSLMATPLLMGMSRVAWGVHWPSDVLGGYMSALLGLSLMALLYGRLGERGSQAMSARSPEGAG